MITDCAWEMKYRMDIKLDKNIYSKDVLLKTAYAFTDKAYLHLSQDAENWIIHWTNKDNAGVSEQDFENEMIAQQLRESLLLKSSDIRKLILARAYASTLIEPGFPSNYNVVST